MSLFARARKAKENKKGFTLVELIVVLVILAILAAILVPALLGWIDEAKKKQYVLEARSIYTAAQAVADEGFAAGAVKDTGTYTTLTDYLKVDPQLTRIATLADVGLGTGNKADPAQISIVEIKEKDSSDHGKYTIKNMRISFKSASDGKFVGATLDNGTWVVKTSDTGAVTPETFATESTGP